MKKLVLSVFVLAVAVFSAKADKTADVTGTAQLLEQIAVSTTLPAGNGGLTGSVSGGALNFGIIGISGAVSKVIVTPTGARSGDGGNPGLSNNTVTPTAAAFAITGGSGMSYTVSYPSSFELNGDNGKKLTVNTLTITGNSTTRSIVAGKDAFAIGGTLNIPADATAGNYNGILTVTVAYN